MTAVELHTKTDCPWCDMAKEFLASRNIPFTTIVHDDDAGRRAFYAQHGCSTVPQVIVVDDGVPFRIDGYAALTLSGIDSLLGSQPE